MNKDAEIKIEITVAESEQGTLVAWPTGENPPQVVKENTSKKHEIYFRYPTYKDNLVFLDSGVKFDDNGTLSFVSNQSRFTRFVTLLKRWSFQDESGKPVPASFENAEMLDPGLSAVIVGQLEKALKFA